jgi:hypothetical protein
VGFDSIVATIRNRNYRCNHFVLFAA